MKPWSVLSSANWTLISWSGTITWPFTEIFSSGLVLFLRGKNLHAPGSTLLRAFQLTKLSVIAMHHHSTHHWLNTNIERLLLVRRRPVRAPWSIHVRKRAICSVVNGVPLSTGGISMSGTLPCNVGDQICFRGCCPKRCRSCYYRPRPPAPLAIIQSVITLGELLRPMAAQAVVFKNRPDVAVKIDFDIGRWRQILRGICAVRRE